VRTLGAMRLNSSGQHRDKESSVIVRAIIVISDCVSEDSGGPSPRDVTLIIVEEFISSSMSDLRASK
jgi:hypothetical protein